MHAVSCVIPSARRSLHVSRWHCCTPKAEVRAWHGGAPDVVRLALVEGGHEAFELRAELGSHAVELEGRALAAPRLPLRLWRPHQQLPEPQEQRGIRCQFRAPTVSRRES